MKFTSRGITILLSVCLLLSASGCRSAETWAEKARARIVPGMTTEEVKEELGEPLQIVRGGQGEPQLWRYQYESGPSTLMTVVLVILLIPLVVALVVVAAKGGGGGLGGIGGGGGGSDNFAEFQVHFDGSGRVAEISPIQVSRKK